jgi:hypothetical protein
MRRYFDILVRLRTVVKIEDWGIYRVENAFDIPLLHLVRFCCKNRAQKAHQHIIRY